MRGKRSWNERTGKVEEMESAGKTVLITRASSGIGYEIAKIYAEKGNNLVLVARREERLIRLKEEIHGSVNAFIDIEIVPMDLSEEGAATRLSGILREKGISVDILLNNAGFGIYGNFHELSQKEMERNGRLLNLNIRVLTELTKIFLDEMKKRNQGEILNVSSIAAFQPGPLMATYYASKAYVLSFTEALQNELIGTGIRISLLCPGPTDTEFERSASLSGSGLFTRMKVMTAEKVARTAYKEFSAGKRIIIPGVLNRIAVIFSKIMPRFLVVKAVRKIQEKK